MDRTLRWRRLCFLYEIGERQARQRYLAIAKRNQALEHRHQEDLQNIRRLQIRYLEDIPPVLRVVTHRLEPIYNGLAHALTVT